ncbi:hypothetical protein FRZ59_02350 [Anseongella ginsenosidimutans]|nr:hypothetical protein FRZ59_02350 [Anseongella ginsenosidimutans]
MDPKEVTALVKLLDDPDEEVYRHVEERLLYHGYEVMNFLENSWEKSLDPVLQDRIINIIHKIQFREVKKELNEWAMSGAFDLLQGILIVNRYQYPDLDEQKVINQLEDIKRDVWLHMNYDMSALEKVKLLNHVIFKTHGFSGNTVNHQDPQNSYLNLVLESKKGNQISLALIYSLIAQKLDIPIYGVNLPQHFILAYVDDQEPVPRGFEKHDGILFYINPFNKGFVFNKRDVDYFLKQLQIEPRKEFYLPCSHIAIVQRILRNLISSYQQLGAREKADELRELLEISGFNTPSGTP